MNNQLKVNINSNISKAEKLLSFEKNSLTSSVESLAHRLVSVKQLIDAFCKEYGEDSYGCEQIPGGKCMYMEYKIGRICKLSTGAGFGRNWDNPKPANDLIFFGGLNRVKLGQLVYRTVHQYMDIACREYIHNIKSSLHPKTVISPYLAYSFCNLYTNFLYVMVGELQYSTTIDKIEPNQFITIRDVFVQNEFINNIIEKSIAIETNNKHLDKCEQIISDKAAESYEIILFGLCRWLFYCTGKAYLGVNKSLFFRGNKLNVDAAYSVYQLLLNFIEDKWDDYKRKVYTFLPIDFLNQIKMDFCEHLSLVIVAKIDSALHQKGIDPFKRNCKHEDALSCMRG